MIRDINKATLPFSRDGFQCLHISCFTRAILTSPINFGGKKIQAVDEKDTFLQNTLPKDVITVKKESIFWIAQ